MVHFLFFIIPFRGHHSGLPPSISPYSQNHHSSHQPSSLFLLPVSCMFTILGPIYLPSLLHTCLNDSQLYLCNFVSKWYIINCSFHSCSCLSVTTHLHPLHAISLVHRPLLWMVVSRYLNSATLTTSTLSSIFPPVSFTHMHSVYFYWLSFLFFPEHAFWKHHTPWHS